MPVFFHSEKIDFSLERRRAYKSWIKTIVSFYGKKVGEVNIIFTSNEYILSINQKFLNHNYFTDVITFAYNDKDIVAGDIFVSIDQVRINGEEFRVTFENELSRVMIHGVLHLLGNNDNSEKERH